MPRRLGGIQVATVRVERVFKGEQAGRVVTLNHGLDSCAPSFRTEDTWLFYLRPAREPGAWPVPPCGRSRAIAWASDDLRILRGLPDSARRSRLSGDVFLHESSPQGSRRPLAGVSLTITGLSGVTEVSTDTDGVYEAYGLPAGRYQVDVKAPDGMKVQFMMPFGGLPHAGRLSEFSLAENGGAGINFVVAVDK